MTCPHCKGEGFTMEYESFEVKVNGGNNELDFKWFHRPCSCERGKLWADSQSNLTATFQANRKKYVDNHKCRVVSSSLLGKRYDRGARDWHEPEYGI